MRYRRASSKLDNKFTRAMFSPLKKSAALVALLLLGSAAHADTAQSLLNKLPASIRENSQSMFSANPIGQVALNGQYSQTSLNDLLARIRADLTAAGYCEEPIRTVVSRGGFSATWAPPKGTTVDGVTPGNYGVLATQAVMLGQSTVNLNTSFRDVLAGDQAVTTACYQDPSKATSTTPGQTDASPKPSVPIKPSIKINFF